ncbi:MAG: hypothetical protein JNJ57_19785 [Saprospiraceae bacterium]|nr:hypothetical protein [Saprospiraceae bacterium]
MNSFNDIESLLEKYWEGDTSLEEERRLKTYFAQGDVDDRHQKYAPLFSAIRQEQAVQLTKSKATPVRPMMYDTRVWLAAASVVLVLIASWWIISGHETNTLAGGGTKETLPERDTQIVMPPQVIQTEQPVYAQTATPVEKPKPIRKKGGRSNQAEAQIDPEAELAMEEIKAALALLSSKIGKGRKEAAKGAEHLETMDKIFKKTAG